MKYNKFQIILVAHDLVTKYLRNISPLSPLAHFYKTCYIYLEWSLQMRWIEQEIGIEAYSPV